MPTELNHARFKETRVRVELFEKSIPKVCPVSRCRKFSGLALSSRAIAKISACSSQEISSSRIKCLTITNE